MSYSTRARRVPLGAEIALAFSAGVASFAVVAVTVATLDSTVLVIGFGAVCLAALVAIVRLWGVAFAVPAAMAGLLAFDWFQFPPTHPLEVPDSGDLAELLLYIVVAVVVGVLAADRGRRADASELARSELADEQAALRRVATLVARGESPDTVFAAVAEEVGHLLEVDGARVIRFDGDDDVMQFAGWSAGVGDLPARGSVKLQRTTLVSEVLRTGRVVRVDDLAAVNDELPPLVRQMGARSGVGAPIVVDGRLWGAMLAWLAHAEPLPDTAEARLSDFTELIATAISTTASRAELARLAEGQAALRRVATLVAQESPPTEVFAKVAEELARLLRSEAARVERYEPDGTVTVVADWAEPGLTVPVGTRLASSGDNIASLVHHTRQPASIDDYAKAEGPLGALARKLGVRSGVGAPIIVEGRLWGVIVAHSREAGPAPAGTESRIGEFAELVATAISNVEARSELAASRARIVAAADGERRRVVRDLHDGAQQRLVHTVVTLKLANRVLEDDAAAPLVAEALGQAERANVELRELAHGILPAALANGGLRAGVEAFASRMPLPVDNEVEVGRLPAPVEATAYFVVAEALTNVAKHAHAEHVAVTASVDDERLQLEVRDDGVGGARTDGTGLVGLSDRLAVVDGQLRVDSPAEGGTRLAAVIPLAR